VPRSDLERRYGPGVHEHTQRMVEAAGLTFDPSPRLPNTLNALLVTELAREHDLHDAVHRRLMHGYWSEQKDLGDEETLLDLVEESARPDRGGDRGSATRSRDRLTREAKCRINAIRRSSRQPPAVWARSRAAFERAVEQLREGVPPNE
jgi:hypothetical protein